jgi:PncC family amidohydrolase
MDGPSTHEREVAVGQLLVRRGLTLALAESCTGGLVSHRITNVPGSSQYYLGAVVAYSNQAKMSILGVKRRTLNEYGAVSEQTAREMAEGVRRLLAADVGAAVTGVAGPGGGTAQKPVGLVFVAVSMPDRVRADRYLWSGDRTRNKELSANALLELLRQCLESVEGC